MELFEVITLLTSRTVLCSPSSSFLGTSLTKSAKSVQQQFNSILVIRFPSFCSQWLKQTNVSQMQTRQLSEGDYLLVKGEEIDDHVMRFHDPRHGHAFCVAEEDCFSVCRNRSTMKLPLNLLSTFLMMFVLQEIAGFMQTTRQHCLSRYLNISSRNFLAPLDWPEDINQF